MPDLDTIAAELLDALPKLSIVRAHRSGTPWLRIGNFGDGTAAWDGHGVTLTSAELLRNYGDVHVIYNPEDSAERTPGGSA